MDGKTERLRLQDLTYGIVGLGIMGGSLAKAIRENILSMSGARGRVLACNRSTACLFQAKAVDLQYVGY